MRGAALMQGAREAVNFLYEHQITGFACSTPAASLGVSLASADQAVKNWETPL